MPEPTCYQCKQTPARERSRFCSDSCALEWAETFAPQMGDEWCPDCNAWLEKSPEHKH